MRTEIPFYKWKCDHCGAIVVKPGPAHEFPEGWREDTTMIGMLEDLCGPCFRKAEEKFRSKNQ